jgi:hypothetical protein
MGIPQVGESFARFVAERALRSEAEEAMRKSPAYARRAAAAYRKWSQVGAQEPAGGTATGASEYSAKVFATEAEKTQPPPTIKVAPGLGQKPPAPRVADRSTLSPEARHLLAVEAASRLDDRRLRVRGLLEAGLKAYAEGTYTKIAGEAFGRATRESATFEQIDAVLLVLGHQKLRGKFPDQTREALRRAADILAAALDGPAQKAADVAAMGNLATRAQKDFGQIEAARYALDLGLGKAKGEPLQELARTAASLGHLDLAAPIFKMNAFKRAFGGDAGSRGWRAWTPPHVSAASAKVKKAPTPAELRAAKVLGVSPATLDLPEVEREAAIKKAFRKLTAKYHPDVNPKAGDAIQQALNAAKDILLPK